MSRGSDRGKVVLDIIRICFSLRRGTDELTTVGARPVAAAMIRHIDAYRERFRVEPICRTVQVAPSTYFALKARPASARSLKDTELKGEIGRVHRQNFSVYGVEN